MADFESAPTLDDCTMVLGVSDHTMAMHQWMLLSAALRRRPEYRCLLADPRLRPAAVANNRAAVLCAYDGGISVLADELPLGLEAQHKLDKEWCAARSAALSPPSELKRKPPPKKTKEKMRTKKKKEPEVSGFIGLRFECCCELAIVLRAGKYIDVIRAFGACFRVAVFRNPCCIVRFHATMTTR